MPRTPQPSTGTTTPEYQPFPEALKWNESYYAPTSQTAEGSRLTGSTDRRAPGDTTGRTSRTQPRADLSRQKSKRNFFEDAFSADLTSLARERVHGDAMVMVEVKTNVIVRKQPNPPRLLGEHTANTSDNTHQISDEFSFITELAYHISMRYQRPVSSVAVTLQHGACLFFGGSFEPAYAMSVVALPSQLLPTTNKRNAALMQRYMEETLGVIPERGCLRFVPAGEENLARGGKTVAGEVEEMEARLRREGVDCGVSGGEDDRGVRNRRMMSVRVSRVQPRLSADTRD